MSRARIVANLGNQDFDNMFAAKVNYALPVNAQTGTTYTFVLADALRLTTASNASASTYTIPPQSSVVWLANSVIRIVNYGAGTVTIAGGAGVTVTNAITTLGQFQSAGLIRTAENAWTLVPFGGVPDLNTAGSRNIQTFTGSGSYTIPQWAKKIDYLIVGGGNSGISGDNSGARGGGNGGQVVRGSTTTFTRGGSITITIGAGGVTVGGINNFGTGGNSSIVIPGGSTFTATGGGGAAGGGESANGANGTLPTAPFDFAYFGGGGGGAIQNGNAGWITNGGNGGGGLGAMGNFATAGRDNTGGGGGGGAFFGGPANGGSGIVLLYFS